jgi:ABC-type phosphate transport system ATPase subunit
MKTNSVRVAKRALTAPNLTSHVFDATRDGRSEAGDLSGGQKLSLCHQKVLRVQRSSRLVGYG